jgi:anthranilate synthase component 2
MTQSTKRVLLIDNYDSFTYNLVHYLMELGASIEVVRNDAINVADIYGKQPDCVVISPGPCSPNEAGICLDLIRASQDSAFPKPLPILGVCLGHQSIGQAFDGTVIRAPYVMHGKTSAIHHKNIGIFRDLPNPFIATRYHSLIVERATLPSSLIVTAETDDGIIMGLQHERLPIHGVQFHPESIASEQGHALLNNFLNSF